MHVFACSNAEIYITRECPGQLARISTNSTGFKVNDHVNFQ
jgi:hypothetical protein